MADQTDVIDPEKIIEEAGREGTPDGAVAKRAHGGVAVPAVAADTGTQALLSTLTEPTFQKLAEDQIYQEMLPRMEVAEKVDVFLVADEFAQRYMLERIAPKLPQESQEKARAVITTVNFGTVAPEERPFFIELAKLHQRISRLMMVVMIERSETRCGFDPIEVAEIRAGIKMADATDSMYKKWEVAQHDISDPAERRKRDFTSKWHVVKKDADSDHFFEAPYQDIYPEEYSAILAALDELIETLERIFNGYMEYLPGETGEGAAKLNFYRKLREAYASTDQAQLPKLWLEVDKAFVHQGGNLRSVHPMEDGYGANVTGTIPEQSLRYFIPNNTNRDIDRRKEFILRRFPELLVDKPEALRQMRFIKKVDARIALYVVRSGMELVFKIAGHNIPNETEARAEGVHIYLDPDTMDGRIAEAKVLFRQFFPPEQHELLGKIQKDAVLADVADHELGHNISGKFVKTPGSAAIEEWKATATTYVAQSLDPDAWSDDALQGTFMARLCQALRYSQRRHEGSQKPYYAADSFFMKTAQEVGLVVPNGDEAGWKLDLTREKLLAYAGKIKEQWLELQGIYESKDEAALNAFVDRAMVRCGFMGSVDQFTQPA